MSKTFEGEDMTATMERVARDVFYETRGLPTNPVSRAGANGVESASENRAGAPQKQLILGD